MKPLFDLTIKQNGIDYIKINNLKGPPLDCFISMTRSITYQERRNSFKISNFITPFFSEDVLIHRLEPRHDLSLRAGYRFRNKDHMFDLTTGMVTYYKGNYDSGTDIFEIDFIETTIESKSYFDYLNNAKPLKQPYLNLTWRDILTLCYDKIDPVSLSNSKLDFVRKKIAPTNLFIIFDEMNKDTGLGYYFANNILYIVDPAKAFNDVYINLNDSKAFQVIKPATLEETDPFRIIESLNPLEGKQLKYSVSTIFNPYLRPGVGIECEDKYGNIKRGIIATITYNIATAYANNEIIFLEDRKNVVE